MKVRISRLRAELRSDHAAIRERLDRLDGVDLSATATDASLALAAWELHHTYGAIESILERCTRAMEGQMPSGPDWHRSLLEGAALSIPGVRGPFLSRELVDGLHELLAFRHFVRHAYTVRLSATRLAELRGRIQQLRPKLDDDLDSLDAWLAELAEAG